MVDNDTEKLRMRLEWLLSQLKSAAPWEDQYLRHNTGISFHLHADGTLHKVDKRGEDGEIVTPLAYRDRRLLKIVIGQISSALKNRSNPHVE